MDEATRDAIVQACMLDLEISLKAQEYALMAVIAALTPEQRMHAGSALQVLTAHAQYSVPEAGHERGLPAADAGALSAQLQAALATWRDRLPPPTPPSKAP